MKRAAVWIALALPLLIAGAMGSCTVRENPTSSSTSSSSSGGTGGDGGMGTGGHTPTGREIFEAFEPQMMSECGACHKLGGAADAAFLAEPDVYSSITSWPGIVVPNASQSLIITHPGDPSHGASQAPDMTPDLRAKVLAWLEKEADDLPAFTDEAGITVYIPPVKPFLKGAFNTIYLDPLGVELENSSISFNAEELNGGSMLMLTNLQVHPIADVSIHIIHPLFTVYPPGKPADPDPVDSFSGYEKTFTIASDSTLGTGTVILANWAKDARLGIAFEKIEGTVTSGTVSTCKDVAKFSAEVVPQIQYCANTCHAGAKIQAKAAMDLSKLADMPPDHACTQVRARITPGNPDMSEMLIVTDPKQQAVHLYKFAGNNNNYMAFKAAVSPWIMAEQ